MRDQLKVLVVEDNPDDILMLKRAFSRGGPKVALRFAHSGQEGLHYLQGVERFADRTLYPLPTLLVLDLKMPGVDGFNIIQWVRQQSEWRDLPIVVLSSSGDPKDMSRAHDLGANAYHVKPNDANALVGMVEGLQMYWGEKEIDPGSLSH
jgi:CheY-like chemotaxis protein